MDVYQDFILRAKKEEFWNSNEKVIVAVSGGVDSVVLLDLVSRLPKSLRPHVTVAHVDHQMREVSGDEVLFVKNLAARYAVSVEVYEWPRETHPKSGLEQAARNIRYTFFKKLAQKLNSSTILTAHHKDDQVETVVMRFVRGNSLDELKGIAPLRQEQGLDIVRPLLPYSKSDLISYAKERQLDWREDETNKASYFTRNRYRNTIIPQLKKENPAFEDHIIRFSEEIKSVIDLIAPFIEEKRKQVIELTDQKIIIDRALFLELDPFVQEKVLVNGVKEWADNQEFLLTQKHLTLYRKWLESSGPNASLDLPNHLIAKRIYDKCTIEQSPQRQDKVDLTKCHKTLEVGQWTDLSPHEKLGLQLYTDFCDREQDANDQYLYLDIDPSKLPLIIRHREHGDKMKVKGLNGSKKLKDMFIDQKIPLKERDQAWVVSDNNGEIIWVIDYKESTLSLDPITDTISYVLVYTNSNNNN